MTPLERAARAYHDSTRQFGMVRDCEFPRKPPVAKPMPFVEWDALDDETKAERFNQVRAVLTAIREPSEGMEDDGVMEGDWNRDNLDLGDEAKKVWQAMIDAALAEGV